MPLSPRALVESFLHNVWNPPPPPPRGVVAVVPVVAEDDGADHKAVEILHPDVSFRVVPGEERIPQGQDGRDRVLSYMRSLHQTWHHFTCTVETMVVEPNQESGQVAVQLVCQGSPAVTTTIAGNNHAHHHAHNQANPTVQWATAAFFTITGGKITHIWILSPQEKNVVHQSSPDGSVSRTVTANPPSTTAVVQRFVPQGTASLVEDAPGWGPSTSTTAATTTTHHHQQHQQTNQGTTELTNGHVEEIGPICWKCRGSGWKPQKTGKHSNSNNNNKRIACTVCQGNQRLRAKGTLAQRQQQPGIIRKARRRQTTTASSASNCWEPSLPMAHALLIKGNDQHSQWRDMVLRADSGQQDVMVPLLAKQGQQADPATVPPPPPIWLPRQGEELCKLNGHWRILQHTVGHKWTTDDCVTAYYAVRTAVRQRGLDTTNNKTVRYLDLGTGNGSVLQMTLRGLLQEQVHITQAQGIEARREAVDLARRSLAFNVGPDFPAKIIHGDFRDVVQSSSDTNDYCGQYDLVTGTPPYFRVDFNVRPGGRVTSAVIREGGMPTARQSAPARCEFRGGIEAYAMAAACALVTDTGRFVVCENFLNHQRVLDAAVSAKLQVLQVAKVHGKQGKPPLFCVYMMRKPTAIELQNEESSSPPFQEETLVVRDIKGNWTPEYVDTVFRTLSIPPLDGTPKREEDRSLRGGPGLPPRKMPLQQKLGFLCMLSILVCSAPLLSVQSSSTHKAVHFRGRRLTTAPWHMSRMNWTHATPLATSETDTLSIPRPSLPDLHSVSTVKQHEEPTNSGTFTGTTASQERLLLQQEEGNTKEDKVTRNIIGAVLAVFCVAVAAGLFLGLMTLDVLDLQIIVRSSVDEDEIMYAKTLLPIIKDRHRLLVTLLLMDTLAYETLPIFLDRLMSGWMAILLSTTLILVVGEILPSGIFTGPNQLYLGYRLAPLVQFFLTLLYPIAKPLGLLLDWLVDESEEDQWYDRGELSALVRIQHEERTKRFAVVPITGQRRLTKVIKYVRNKDRHWNDLKAEIFESVKEREGDNDGDLDEASAAVEQLTPPLHQREVDMVEGALSMKTKLAMDVYTPLKQVYAVPDDLVLDKATITTIYGNGFSRVPVYRRNANDPDDITAITGYLITRQLMLVDWDHLRTIDTLPLTRPTCVSPRINLVDLLKLLQSQGPLLTFVCARPDLANRALKAEKSIPVEAGLIGIISLVDIMESILQDRIYDESDIRDRNQAVATLQSWAATKLQSFVRRRRRSLVRSGSAIRNRLGDSTSPPPKRSRTSQTMAELVLPVPPLMTSHAHPPTEETPLLSGSGADDSLESLV